MAQLPKWVVSNEESVWRETEQSRHMTPAQRWGETIAACEVLRFYWFLPGYAERIRAAEDLLPESSILALRQLREQYRRGQR